jgi:hypothetical protein
VSLAASGPVPRAYIFRRLAHNGQARSRTCEHPWTKGPRWPRRVRRAESQLPGSQREERRMVANAGSSSTVQNIIKFLNSGNPNIRAVQKFMLMARVQHAAKLGDVDAQRFVQLCELDSHCCGEALNGLSSICWAEALASVVRRRQRRFAFATDLACIALPDRCRSLAAHAEDYSAIFAFRSLGRLHWRAGCRTYF